MHKKWTLKVAHYWKSRLASNICKCANQWYFCLLCLPALKNYWLLTCRTQCHVNLLTPPATGLDIPRTQTTNMVYTYAPGVTDGDDEVLTVTNQSTGNLALIRGGDGTLSRERARRSPARLAPMNASPSPRPGRKCCPGCFVICSCVHSVHVVLSWLCVLISCILLCSIYVGYGLI